MKHRILSLLEFASYYCGIEALFCWLNRKADRFMSFHDALPAVIFKHNMANGIYHSESEFRLIVSEEAKRFSLSVDIDDTRTATITFEDGFVGLLPCREDIFMPRMSIPANKDLLYFCLIGAELLVRTYKLLAV